MLSHRDLNFDGTEAKTQHLYVFRKTEWWKRYKWNINGNWMRLVDTCQKYPVPNMSEQTPMISWYIHEHPKLLLWWPIQLFKVRMPWLVCTWTPQINVRQADLVCPRPKEGLRKWKTALLAARPWHSQLEINSTHGNKYCSEKATLWPCLKLERDKATSQPGKWFNSPFPPLTNRTHCSSHTNDDSSPFVILPPLKEKLPIPPDNMQFRTCFCFQNPL